MADRPEAAPRSDSGAGNGVSEVASPTAAATAAAPGSEGGLVPQQADGWQEFMDEGGSLQTPEAAGTAARRPAASAVVAGGHPQSPGAFFSGLLQKVSTSFEHTLETAKREISRRDLLAHAQENINELRGVLPYPTGPAGAAAGSGAGSGSGAARGSVDSGGGHGRGRHAKSAKYLRSLDDTRTTKELTSLRLNTTNGTQPLFAAINEHTRDLIVVTERTIEAFDAIHRRKILESKMEAGPPSEPVGPTEFNPERSEQPESGGTSVMGNHGTVDQASPKRSASQQRAESLLAMCAGLLSATQEIIVGCRDCSLCLFSVKAGQMGAFVRQSYVVSEVLNTSCAIVSLALMPGKPSRVAVGCLDGSVVLVETSGLTVVQRFQVPEMCCAPAGSGLPNSPVCCLHACTSEIEQQESDCAPESASRLVIAYQEGVVSMCGGSPKDIQAPFVAQSGDVKGLATFFDDALIVSIGNDVDPSLSVTEAISGRCLARRMLPYTPTAVSKVKRASSPSRSERSPCCPSENTFIIGGNEGQLEVFRVSMLSPCPRVELALIRSISERHRKSREVTHIFYDYPDNTIYAVSVNCEVRMWKLGSADALALCLPHTANSCAFNEQNIVEVLRSDYKLEEPRLSASDDIIAAQKVLASVLEEDIGITEQGKDALVSDFQRQQAEMQDSAVRAGKDFMRTRRRVQSRYARGMALCCREDTSIIARAAYVSAAKKSAALEIAFAHTMYIEHLRIIRKLTTENLQVTLLDALLSAVGDSSKIEELRTAAVLLVDVDDSRQ